MDQELVVASYKVRVDLLQVEPSLQLGDHLKDLQPKLELVVVKDLDPYLEELDEMLLLKLYLEVMGNLFRILHVY